jgi:alginate O-acetyltransferase complex protein AlgI
MVFSSLTFILAFLPITLVLYFFARKELKNYVLLAVSLFFYAWGEPVYIFLMILSICVNYFLALNIGRLKRRNGGDRNISVNLFFMLSLIFNISCIGFFKYGNFIITNLNNIFGTQIEALDVSLPIGISFYTFQILSYVIDVWKGKSEPQRNIIRLGTYISLFPQLIAGPIIKYETIESQLGDRTVTIDDVTYGMKRFCLGLAKKVIVANHMGLIVSTIQALSVAEASRGLLWLAAIAYVYQLYFDFSAYSDMAIGLSRIFGFHFPENFKHPFASRSAAEFWQRFHISLIKWLQEYIYFPLGGSRRSRPRWILNMLVVWGVSGLWHGADWNFILWGVTYAVIMIIESFIIKKLRIHDKAAALGKIYYVIGSIFAWAWAMFAYIFTCIIFRLSDLQILGDTMKKMFFLTADSGHDIASYLAGNPSFGIACLFLPIAFFGAFPVMAKCFERMQRSAIGNAVVYIWCVAVFYISIVALLGAEYNPFIYYRF